MFSCKYFYCEWTTSCINFFQIQLDFDAIHPGRANKFYINWNDFIKKIIEIKKANTNEEVAALVEYINGIDDEGWYK